MLQTQITIPVRSIETINDVLRELYVRREAVNALIRSLEAYDKLGKTSEKNRK